MRVLCTRELNCDDEIVPGGYSTGWRSIPCLIFNQWLGSDLRVDFDHQPSVVVPDGQGLLLSPNIRHNLTLVGPAATARCRWIHFLAWLHGTIDVFSLVQPNLVVDRGIADRLGDLSAELACVHQGCADLLAEARRMAILGSIMTEVLGQCDQNLAGVTLHRMRPILGALVWMRDHLQEPISRVHLARAVGLSTSRFHSVFKEILGSAPMEYLAHLRLQEAQRLLAEDTMPVQAVALACGFSDPFHFSRRFKAVHGVAPAVWRQQYLDAATIRSDFSASGGEIAEECVETGARPRNQGNRPANPIMESSLPASDP